MKPMPTTACTDRAAALLANNVKVFLEIKSAYDECDRDIQEVIDDMCAVCSSDDASREQKHRAMHTIIEALFPSLAVDILESITALDNLPESIEYEKQLDSEEETFSERLKTAMREKGWTQEKLAERTGVGQPAISNMLNRQSRPQRRTVLRIAEALDVPPESLWPGYSITDAPSGKK